MALILRIACAICLCCAIPAYAGVTSSDVVGVWHGEVVRPTVRVVGITTFNADGTFSLSSDVRREGADALVVEVSGRWWVEGDFLYEEIITSSNPQLAPCGMVVRDQVLSIVGDHMQLRTERGEVLVRARRLTPPSSGQPSAAAHVQR